MYFLVLSICILKRMHYRRMILLGSLVHVANICVLDHFFLFVYFRFVTLGEYKVSSNTKCHKSEADEKYIPNLCEKNLFSLNTPFCKLNNGDRVSKHRAEDKRIL